MGADGLAVRRGGWFSRILLILLGLVLLFGALWTWFGPVPGFIGAAMLMLVGAALLVRVR